MTRATTPHDAVTGVVDDPTNVASIGAALNEAGFSPEAVQCFVGEEALSLVNPKGEGMGFFGRLTRGLEHFGEEATEHYAAQNELQAGHALMAVTAKTEDEKARATSILRDGGVRRLRYWGRWEIEELS